MVRWQLERRTGRGTSSSPQRNRRGRIRNERRSDEDSHRTRSNGPDDVRAHRQCKRRRRAKRHRTLRGRAAEPQDVWLHPAQPEAVGDRQAESQGLRRQRPAEPARARCIVASWCDRALVDLTRPSEIERDGGEPQSAPFLSELGANSGNTGKTAHYLPALLWHDEMGHSQPSPSDTRACPGRRLVDGAIDETNGARLALARFGVTLLGSRFAERRTPRWSLIDVVPLSESRRWWPLTAPISSRLTRGATAAAVWLTAARVGQAEAGKVNPEEKRRKCLAADPFRKSSGMLGVPKAAAGASCEEARGRDDWTPRAVQFAQTASAATSGRAPTAARKRGDRILVGGKRARQHDVRSSSPKLGCNRSGVRPQRDADADLP